MKVKIYDYGMNGEGIAKTDEGKLMFVDSSLVGEEVEAEIFEEKENFAFAVTKKIYSPSLARDAPPCPYFGECGGCDLQHMTYDEQLKYKASLVEKTIKKIAGIKVKVEKTVPSEKQYFYRNKLTLAIADGKIGFFKKNSHDLIEVNTCMISCPEINEAIALFRSYLSKKDHTFCSKLKNLVIRSLAGQLLVGVVAKERVELGDFYEILRKNFNQIGLYLILNNRKDSVVLAGEAKLIGGQKHLSIENFGIKYELDLMSFHQTNLDIQNKIYEEILALIPAGAVVINGFSGAGLLSAMISRKSSQVYGIEIEKSSHRDAEKLKTMNNIPNLTNICGDFVKVFPQLKKNADFLILDPSKKGCGEKITREIFDIKRVIYVSCNPIALAKDLRILTQNYTIEKVYIFDMFPNTKNVETLVSLKLK